MGDTQWQREVFANSFRRTPDGPSTWSSLSFFSSCSRCPKFRSMAIVIRNPPQTKKALLRVDQAGREFSQLHSFSSLFAQPSISVSWSNGFVENRWRRKKKNSIVGSIAGVIAVYQIARVY